MVFINLRFWAERVDLTNVLSAQLCSGIKRRHSSVSQLAVSSREGLSSRYGRTWCVRHWRLDAQTAASSFQIWAVVSHEPRPLGGQKKKSDQRRFALKCGEAERPKLLEQAVHARRLCQTGGARERRHLASCRNRNGLSKSAADMDQDKRLLVVAGPSGVGKGTLVQMLATKFPDSFRFSVSHTSRPPRDGEVHGQHYYFHSKEEIEELIAQGQFLEHACVHGNLYGTSLREVENILAEGKICLVEVDVQGVRQIKHSEFGQSGNYLFICPPSVEELEQRLRQRGTEEEEKIRARVKAAQAEMDEAQVLGFDFRLTNNVLSTAFENLVMTVVTWYPWLQKSVRT